ncbi:MAG: hypothetical protein ABI867_24435 [Kofleriaceae bacterium]
MPQLIDLFEVTPKLSRVFVDELDSVADGSKAMVLWPLSWEALFSSEDDVATGHDEYRRLVDFCIDHDLVLTQYSETEMAYGVRHCNVTLLITRRSQAWRVPAFTAFCEAFRGRSWSDAAEVLRSKLLGYPDDEIDRWLAYQHSRTAMWGAETLFFLVTTEQQETLAKLGNRCLHELVVGDGLAMFAVRDEMIARKEAVDLCRPMVLARVGMDWKYFWSKLPGGPNRSVAIPTMQVMTGDLADVNNALRSRIEFWTGEGWK